MSEIVRFEEYLRGCRSPTLHAPLIEAVNTHTVGYYATTELRGHLNRDPATQAVRCTTALYMLFKRHTTGLDIPLES